MRIINAISQKGLALLLSGLFFCIHFPWIWCVHLWGSSEAREAQVVWTISHTGEWILPLRNGIIPSKPPLFHWLGFFVAHGFGVSSLIAVRLVSLIAACATIFFTLQIGTVIWQKTRGLAGGNTINYMVLLWFVLASSYAFFANAGDAKVDMTFACFVTAAVSGFLRHWIAGDLVTGRRAAFLWLWICIAFAVLTKGPLGLILSLLLAFVGASCYSGIRTALTEFSRLRISMVYGLFIVICWYVLAVSVGGFAFIEKQFLFENLQRFTGGQEMNSEEWWFYALSLFRTMFPWSLVAVVSVLFELYSSRRKALRVWDQEVRLRFLGYIVTIFGCFFLSLSSGKRHSYLLPLIPWFSISIACILEDWQGRLRLSCSRFFEHGYSIVSQFFVIVSVSIAALLSTAQIVRGLKLTPRTYLVSEWIHPTGVYFSFGLLTSVVIYYSINRYAALTSTWRVISLPLSICLSASIIFYTGLSIKAEFRNFYFNAPRIVTSIQGQPLTVIKSARDEYFDPLFYYFDRQVQVRTEPDDCKGIFLAKRDYLMSIPHPYQFDEREIYGEVPAKFGEKKSPEKKSSELVLFTCQRL